MDFVNTARIPAPRERVWAFLKDMEAVGRCVPGVESMEKTGDDSYRGAMKIKVGPISLKFEGDMVLESQDEESGTTQMRAQAADKRVGGSVKADITMQATGVSASETELTVRTNAAVLGRLGEFGQPVMRKKADQIMNEFASNVARQVTASGSSA